METRLTLGSLALAASLWPAGTAHSEPMKIPALMAGSVHAQAERVTSQEQVPIDYLTFAAGAIPIGVFGAGANQGADLTHAVQIVDGNPTGFSIVNRATDETDTEFVYVLPAPTTFDRFAVPNVLETPSPSQTFMRVVEVYGSSSGPDSGFELLASGTLTTHAERDQMTELTMASTQPVRWVKVRLVGGIEMLADLMFLEFGEIIGNGTQDVPDLEDHFGGQWRGRGLKIDLDQEGAVVSGCVDGLVPVEGTVTGSILRATGVDPNTGVISLFILGLSEDESMRGLRSTNGAPFRLYEGEQAPDAAGLDCPDKGEPVLGCGSVIHGISFDFDSAAIRRDSDAVLAQLFEGLESDGAASVVIEGHTSAEGSDAYNLELSERRAQAVVDDLAARGIAVDRLSALGRGEATPIASNDNESGRSLNRRVEVHCS